MFSFYSTWAVHDALITLISVGPFVPFSEIMMAMYMFYYIHLLQNFFSLPLLLFKNYYLFYICDCLACFYVYVLCVYSDLRGQKMVVDTQNWS